MAYNNYFPAGYQPVYYPQYQPQINPSEGGFQQMQTNNRINQNTPANGLIWVQGEAGAKAYPVAPGQTVDLWDSENTIIYLKSADPSGMPSMKILDYTIREDTKKNPVMAKQEIDMSNYVTKEELKKIIEEMKNESVISADAKPFAE